jgi:hypothetical protein
MTDPAFVRLSRKDFIDYEFFVHELVRIAQMGIPQLREFAEKSRHDLLPTIRNPITNSLMLTSREMRTRIRQAAIRGLETFGDEAKKFDLGDLIGELQREVFRRYTEDPPTITDENAHQIFLSAAQNQLNRFEEITHYIPCSIASHEQPTRFEIGPVQFRLSKIFWPEIQKSVRELKFVTEMRLEMLREFFNSHKWVAIVRVPPASLSVSTLRARQTISASLNLFKLFVGGRTVARVRHAYEPGFVRETSVLWSGEKDGFHLSTIFGGIDAHVDGNWIEDVRNFPQWKFGATTIQRKLTEWSPLPEAEERFMDALTWHGEAISDARPEARIIKFWTAIERIVSFQKKDNVTLRAAVMSITPKQDLESYVRRCQTLYSFRSEVVHGNAPRQGTKMESMAHEIEDISQNVLIGYTRIAIHLKQIGGLDRDSVEGQFKRLDEISKNKLSRGKKG